jgi:hypothetical protein
MMMVHLLFSMVAVCNILEPVFWGSNDIINDDRVLMFRLRWLARKADQ